MTREQARALAVKLRVEDRLSLREIAERSGLSTATVSKLVRQWPLSSEEVARKAYEGMLRYGKAKAND